MRILHIFDHSLPIQSGYSFRSMAILREQRNLGWQTLQMTSPKHGKFTSPVETVAGFDFVRVAPATSAFSRLPAMDQLAVVSETRKRLRALIQETQPDILQAHSPCLNALAALGLGKPLVYELRSSWEDAAVSSGTTTEGSLRYRLSRALETYVLRRADAITTICEGLRKDVLTRGVTADRVTVVPNAVDPAEFARQHANALDMRAKYNLQDNCVVGFAGSFFAWEGLPLLMEAMPEVLASRPDVRVLLVGKGPDEPAVREAVKRHGLEKIVIFAGQLPHDQVGAAYDAIDILAYPRTPMRLTEMVTPLKPLEAMALSKVFVASDVGGHKELVNDGVTGILFRAGDRSALAKSILRVAADEGLRRSLQAAGPQFIRQERTWAHVVRRYEPVYRSLLSAPAAAANVHS